jgi:hypothetical protein
MAGAAVAARRARDDEVARWRQDGWVLLEGLVPTDELDAAALDLGALYPSPEEYHADPAGVTEQWRGRPPARPAEYVWPPGGPGFRPEQHRWNCDFPFAGSGALNRLCVHPAIGSHEWLRSVCIGCS